tara:strand:+ start:147 stop:719 length:573 start_codon:yes stop_codon:yes gene_type:complete
MKASESIENLAAALLDAQSEMGGAVMDSENPFFKSKYADLTSVIKCIKEPFTSHCLSYTQFPVSNERGVGVCTRLMHSSGEWIENEFVLPLSKQDPQSAGAAITYARRYSLAAIAGIPQVDDDAESAMLRKQDVITGADIDWLKKHLKNDKAMDSFKQWIAAKGIDSIESITQEQFVEIKPKVEARAKHD